MIEIKIRVLEKVSDYYGTTLVMRRREVQKTKWWKPGKVISDKTITIWTTDEEDLIRRDDFHPLHDWLVVNSAFRRYGKDFMEIGIKGVLKDDVLRKVAKRVLTF